MSKPKIVERPKHQPAAYTLEEAFDFLVGPDSMDVHGELNFERAIRAVGFLLHWCTQMGNEPMAGNAANGLGDVLEYTAGQLCFIQGAHRRELNELQDKLRRATAGNGTAE